MGISTNTVTEYKVECDICGLTETLFSSNGRIRSKAQAIKFANMTRKKNGSILCQSCNEKSKMVGQIVACNNRGKEWCPYGKGNTKCDAHTPREKVFGEDIFFHCWVNEGGKTVHKKCRLEKIS